MSANAVPGPKTAAQTARTVTAGRARVVLYTLCAVYVLNFLDRSLLAILAKPIQDSLHLSDGQIGLIAGLYFAFFYCFIAIPIGWLADKTNRVNVLSLACAIWSVATAFCGFAASYPQLVASRMIVGVGEAGGVPPSYALITDYFPPGRRGAALGIYNLGPPIGAALGIAFGAAVAAAFNWRDAFIAIGAIGLFAAVAIRLIIREPARGGLDAAAAARAGSASAVLGNGAGVLFPADAGARRAGQRRHAAHHLRSGQLHHALPDAREGHDARSGRRVLRAGGRHRDECRHAGFRPDARSPHAPLAGRLCHHARRVAGARHPASTWGSSGPPSWPLALLFLLAAPMFLNYFYLSSSIALVQEEVRPDQRVMAGALLLLVMNFIGLGLGPTYVGAASDFFHASHPQHSLQLALYTLTPFYLVAIVIFLCLARVLRGTSRASGGIAP